MNEKIKIEHGIPIPPSKRGSSMTGKILREMKIGDSIVVTQRQSSSFVTMGNYLKIKLKSRTLDDNKVRIWRVE